MAHSTQPTAKGTRSGAQSIERAVQLLRLVAAQPACATTLQQLVQASGLERTTAHRIAGSLVRAGLLRRDADSSAYALGLEAMGLGLAAMQDAPLLRRAVPAIKSLARRSGEHVFLVVRTGDYSQCLHLEEGPRPIRSFAETVGSMRLLGLGIPSFAFLAHMQDEEVMAHYARHAVEYQARRLSAARLQRWVRQARELGYAQVAAQGIGGIGMRFAIGSCGEGALGIVAPASRMTRARNPLLAAMMAEEIKRLG